MKDCTAAKYLDSGYMLVSAAQFGILQRMRDYSMACRGWADTMATRDGGRFMDHLRCNDLARMAATLAFIAFPDLREQREIQEAA